MKVFGPYTFFSILYFHTSHYILEHKEKEQQQNYLSYELFSGIYTRWELLMGKQHQTARVSQNNFTRQAIFGIRETTG